MTQPSEAFTSIALSYLPETPPEQRYDRHAELTTTTYLGAIVGSAANLRPLLSGRNFLHVDGALVLDRASATVQHVPPPVQGRDEFVYEFRPIVNAQAAPNGSATGTWIPAETWRSVIEPQLLAQLPPETSLGRFVAAAAVVFPYKLRPEADTPPVELPPELHYLLRKGEKPFDPIRALNDEGRPDWDEYHVLALQGLYADAHGKITARVGLVWNNPRAVPFAIHEEITARRSLPHGAPYPMLRPEAVVRQLVELTA